jgi:alkylation response protein AidB-like acyl-CoA dehydrogenase
MTTAPDAAACGLGPATPDWEHTARRLADRLAADAAAREAVTEAPVFEVEELRRSGLLTLLVPADRGGAGLGWAEALRAVGIVGAADASVGHLLGYHHLHLWRAGLFDDPGRAAALEGDGDHLGQRLSASGSAVFDDVAVAPADVLGVDDPDAPTGRRSLVPVGFQLVLARLYAALAEGALAAAAAYLRAHGRPWPAGGAERAVDDPYVLAGFGVLVARTAAAEALVGRAVEAFAAADHPGLTPAARGAAAVAVARAKVVPARRRWT